MYYRSGRVMNHGFLRRITIAYSKMPLKGALLTVQAPSAIPVLGSESWAPSVTLKQP